MGNEFLSISTSQYSLPMQFSPIDYSSLTHRSTATSSISIPIPSNGRHIYQYSSILLSHCLPFCRMHSFWIKSRIMSSIVYFCSRVVIVLFAFLFVLFHVRYYQYAECIERNKCFLGDLAVPTFHRFRHVEHVEESPMFSFLSERAVNNSILLMMVDYGYLNMWNNSYRCGNLSQYSNVVIFCLDSKSFQVGYLLSIDG